MKTTSLNFVLGVMLMVSGAVFASGKGRPFNDADFKAELSGAEEVPPVISNTFGEAKFIRNGGNLNFELEVEDASGILGVAGAHIHCAPFGQNGSVVAFLAGPFTPGYDGKIEIKATITNASIINDTCGADLSALIASMEAGMSYVNVHSIRNPSGEVRGQINLD